MRKRRTDPRFRKKEISSERSSASIINPVLNANQSGLDDSIVIPIPLGNSERSLVSKVGVGTGKPF
jgi:hypothetical protein